MRAQREGAARVGIYRLNGQRRQAMEEAIQYTACLATVRPGDRVALKPNLTYPYYKKGVTTSPAHVEALLSILADLGAKVMIVESDGGYGVWSAEEAFEGHGLYALAKRFSAEVVSLSGMPSRSIPVSRFGQVHRVPLPCLLLDEVDALVTLPVPKIHAMTGLTLGLKNQWGCIPDSMRLRNHHLFDKAIVEINATLRPVVVADGEYFLDQNGPMDGAPVPMDLVLASNDVFAFDRTVAELMRWDWKKVSHLRAAAQAGQMPKDLSMIVCNRDVRTISEHHFVLHRTVRSWIALAGFKSRFVTWFGYESWFGREVLHRLLYAIAGPNIKPAPDGDKSGGEA